MMVVPAGLVSILLIMSQPLLVGAWCFWCLLTAVCMLAMIAFAVDEVVAACLHIASCRRRGLSLWQSLKGLENSQGSKDERTPTTFDHPASWRAAAWGLSWTPSLLGMAAIGSFILFTPHWLGLEGIARAVATMAGALAVTFSVISAAEVLQALRRANIFIGGVLSLAPFCLNYPQGALAVHVGAGLLLAALAFSKARCRERYGSWQRWIF
jgi:hypothetical protein